MLLATLSNKSPRGNVLLPYLIAFLQNNQKHNLCILNLNLNAACSLLPLNIQCTFNVYCYLMYLENKYHNEESLQKGPDVAKNKNENFC